MFHWNYLNETMKKTVPRRADQVGFYMIGVTNKDLAPEVAVEIDRTFKNSLAETMTETERAFQLGFISMTEAILIAVQIVSYVVIVIIMVVAANTMAMTARERISSMPPSRPSASENGTLGDCFGESLVIAMTGGIIGALLTFPAARWFEVELSQYFPVFSVSPMTIYLDSLLPWDRCGGSGLSHVADATIRIVDGLRRIG